MHMAGSAGSSVMGSASHQQHYSMQQTQPYQMQGNPSAAGAAPAAFDPRSDDDM
jgi:hypothetical protein